MSLNIFAVTNKSKSSKLAVEGVLAPWFQAMAICGCVATTNKTRMNQLLSRKSLQKRKLQARVLNLKKTNKRSPIVGLIVKVFLVNRVKATNTS